MWINVRVVVITPFIDLITVNTSRHGVVCQVTPLINIPKIRQLSKLLDDVVLLSMIYY